MKNARSIKSRLYTAITLLVILITLFHVKYVDAREFKVTTRVIAAYNALKENNEVARIHFMEKNPDRVLFYEKLQEKNQLAEHKQTEKTIKGILRQESEAKRKAYEEKLKKEEEERRRKEEEEKTKAQMSSGTKGDYQAYAYSLFSRYGWGASELNPLILLWERESGWNPLAHNSYSGAHGIPQSLPASKMASHGSDYYDNGYTQIRWGLDYINSRYGSPSSAWAHSESVGWY